MTTIRAFFLQIRALFSNLEKGQGRPPLLPLSSYVHVKQTIVSYKMNPFSVHCDRKIEQKLYTVN